MRSYDIAFLGVLALSSLGVISMVFNWKVPSFLFLLAAVLCFVAEVVL